jgi:osmoprotectant transport system substrate-binding protein
MRAQITVVVALCAASAGLTACQSTPRTANRSATPYRPVVVASFNFTESEILAELYAGALERAGIPVRRELDLGARELVEPALAQGHVDVVPEYLGTALRFIDPASPAQGAGTAAEHAALNGALRLWGAEALTPSPAQDQNALAMLASRARALHARTTSDLRQHRGLVLGGPPECPTREFCLLGFENVYGLRFGEFMPLAEQAQTKTALEQGVIDVAVMFTTDPQFADPSIVVLRDDRHLQPEENVVPVVSTRVLRDYGPRVAKVLNSVSAQLTSGALIFLNWRVDLDGRTVADEAAGWLARHR